MTTTTPWMRTCPLDAHAKFREVRCALDRVRDEALKTRLEGLFLRGVFRHSDDVAFATILILDQQKSDTDVEGEVAEGYRGMRCDPVYPQ